MPLYEYQCDDCGHADSEFQKMSSDPLIVCPKCSSEKYRKLISLPHTDLKEFHTPIEMYSIAMDNDHEIREFQRKAGSDVRVSDDQNDPMYGIPIAANRKQKLAALHAAGYAENK